MKPNLFSTSHLVRFAKVWLVVVGLLVLVAGCRATPPPTLPPSPGPTPTVAAQPAIAPTSVITPTNNILTLTWWTPEFISPQAAQPAGPLLATYLSDFEAARDGKVQVNPVLKARYGKGGLLDFLRTAQPVAPGILPDLVTLDVTELEQAATLGLLQPLDELLDSDTISALYPFARQAGQFDGQLLAVQFIADLEHLGYIPSRVETPPQTWAELLSSGNSYLFPAGSPQPLSMVRPTDDVQPSFISQYLSAGGTLDPETRQLALEQEPLLRVLTFYSDGIKAGLLAPNAVEVSDLDYVWKAYIKGLAPLANVSARRYLAEGTSLPNVGFAAVPGWDGPATPVAGGWALAIVTTDPTRQQAAADFIAWLLAPQRAGGWAQAAGWLPTAPGAMAVWGTDPYYAFLDQQLALAVSHPVGADYPQVASRLHEAIVAVLKGTSSPAEATQAALNPPK